MDFISSSLDVQIAEKGKLKKVLFGEESEVRFLKPTYIAVKNEVMYVSDLGRVYVFNFKKKKFITLGNGVLRQATGIAVTNDGTLYVADSSLKRIIIKKANDPSAIIVGSDKLVSPGGIAVDETRGRLLVADAQKHSIVEYSMEGKYLRDIGRRGGKPGEFNFPYDVKIDDEGYIYVMDSGNFRVQILDPEGKFLTEFGDVGSEPGFFARPKGIAVDSEGYIYVVDAAFGNFQIFDAEGGVYLSVGENGTAPSKFLLPFGIAIDEDEKIYVVDQINRRIQIFERLKYSDERDKKPVRASDIEF